MSILNYDTETSGFTKEGAPPSDPEQPYLIQLGAQLLTGPELKEVAFMDRILRWEGVTIPEGAVKTHGITTERMMDEGIPPYDALLEFHNLCIKAAEGGAGAVSAFNLAFDDLVMLAAYHRVGGSGKGYKPLKKICIMQSALDSCKLPKKSGGTGYKSPSLKEAYGLLVDAKGFKDAHTALADARAAGDVLRVLALRSLPLTYNAPTTTARSRVDGNDLTKLDKILSAAVEEENKLSEWENGFIRDTVERREKYGDGTRVSDKQWVILNRIQGKLNGEEQGFRR